MSFILAFHICLCRLLLLIILFCLCLIRLFLRLSSIYYWFYYQHFTQPQLCLHLLKTQFAQTINSMKEKNEEKNEFHLSLLLLLFRHLAMIYNVRSCLCIQLQPNEFFYLHLKNSIGKISTKSICKMFFLLLLFFFSFFWFSSLVFVSSLEIRLAHSKSCNGNVRFLFHFFFILRCFRVFVTQFLLKETRCRFCMRSRWQQCNETQPDDDDHNCVNFYLFSIVKWFLHVFHFALNLNAVRSTIS